jgi:hypothetical protein
MRVLVVGAGIVGAIYGWALRAGITLCILYGPAEP